MSLNTPDLLHIPHRLTGETFEAYRKRRAASQAEAARLTAQGIGLQRPIASSRESLRDEQRKNGTLRGIYGLGLLQPQRKRGY